MQGKTGRAILVLAIGLAGMGAGELRAEGLSLRAASSSSRSSLFRNQTRLLDTRAASQYAASVDLRPHSAFEDDRLALPDYRGRYRGKFLPLARAAAVRHNIPEDLFLRLIDQESGWNPGAVSSAGAQGLAQLMPATAAKLGVDINDPHSNLEGGARYLRMMYERFGNWRLALAAYNAGPEAVAKYGDVPPYRETKNYVRAILGI